MGRGKYSGKNTKTFPPGVELGKNPKVEDKNPNVEAKNAKIEDKNPKIEDKNVNFSPWNLAKKIPKYLPLHCPLVF